MPRSSRIEFRKKYHKFLTINRSPLPMVNAKRLIEEYENERFDMVTDSLDIVKDTDAFKIKLNDESFYEDAYKYVINATGLDLFMRDIDKINPLIKELLDKRYASIYEYGGFAVVPGSQRIISHFGEFENLHAHGVLTAGVQYRNNSTMMIQMTAHKLIKFLYEQEGK